LAAKGVYERGEDNQDVVRVITNPRTCPYIAHQAKIWQDNTLTDFVCLIVSTFSME
jgi:hypothetical protein